MNLYLDLFLTFAKVGVCTFGGGYAMLPILQREVVENKGWATEEELTDYFAIGQCTPGVIAVNTATFIGYKYKGIIGGILTTLGVVFPSLIIITLIAAFLSNFAHIPAVQHALPRRGSHQQVGAHGLLGGGEKGCVGGDAPLVCPLLLIQHTSQKQTALAVSGVFVQQLCFVHGAVPLPSGLENFVSPNRMFIETSISRQSAYCQRK